MGRPLLPIWKEFVTTLPADADKRSPDVACLHCRVVVCNARPANLMRHVLKCTEIPLETRLSLRSDGPPSATVTHEELEAAMAGQQRARQSLVEEEEVDVEQLTEHRPVLGKRPRSATGIGPDNLERVLTSIRDVMAKTLGCKQQELQLRREELEFQKEALATKLEDRRRAREDERRDRKEQREADRQERLELARIENEKNLAFLKAVMESSTQQRR
ncbi:hypothetical protein PHMEG_00015882 [Phytophthora megakarya]|uniref:Uncharacterized protein n=1 Tax=Phytophthora megakarya TaxID=4795 RepID=A0A225W1P9_9STRA|nr:hypothetical protein PHMEG_00015882 [Phytophthora megakarya]